MKTLLNTLRCCSPFGIPVVRGEVGHGYRRLFHRPHFIPHSFHDEDNYGTIVTVGAATFQLQVIQLLRMILPKLAGNFQNKMWTSIMFGTNLSWQSVVQSLC